MSPELRQRILAYNRGVKAQREKAADMDILVSALLTLPPGQLKKLLSEEVLGVMEKYGGSYVQ